MSKLDIEFIEALQLPSVEIALGETGSKNEQMRVPGALSMYGATEAIRSVINLSKEIKNSPELHQERSFRVPGALG